MAEKNITIDSLTKSTITNITQADIEAAKTNDQQVRSVAAAAAISRVTGKPFNEVAVLDKKGTEELYKKFSIAQRKAVDAFMDIIPEPHICEKALMTGRVLDYPKVAKVYDDIVSSVFTNAVQQANGFWDNYTQEQKERAKKVDLIVDGIHQLFPKSPELNQMLELESNLQSEIKLCKK